MAAIEIPSLVGFRSRRFDIGHVQQSSPQGQAGFLQTINRTSPFWYAEYETPPMSEAVYNEAVVFRDYLEGSMNTFLAYDPRRRMPQAYKMMATTAFPWGIARLSAFDYSASTIDLDTMTEGAIITKGDYISVQVGLIWYLFRAQQTRVVNSSNVVTGLIVKPRPNIVGFTVPVAIRYQKACMEMKVIGDIEETDDVTTFPSFKFRAGQFTRRGDIG